MGRALFGVIAVTFVASGSVWTGGVLASERKSPINKDECSRLSATCERQCESKSGQARLSCKTDCRLSESRCRSGKR